MEIQTTRFGKIEIDAETILSFPNGIPGFEKYTKFKLFHNEKSDAEGVRSLYWLQSLDDPDVAFHAIDPFEFGFNYEFALTDEETELLKVEDINDIAMLLFVSKLEAPKQGKSNVKAHMSAPIVINLKSAIGFQKMLRNINYDLNYNLNIKNIE